MSRDTLERVTGLVKKAVASFFFFTALHYAAGEDPYDTEKKLIEVMIFQGESSRVVEELSQVMLDDVCLTTLLLVVVKVDLALGFLKLLT